MTQENQTSAVAVRDDMVTSAVDPQVAEAMRIKEQLETVKSVLAPDLNDQELQLFAMVSQRLRLDPFIRQIHAIKRNSRQGPRLTFQTGIDGFRASAEETGEYRGSDEPEFGPTVAQPFAHPEWAKVTVYRQYENGDVRGQSHTVYWNELYPGDAEGFMWRKMPRNQLAKCAEAGAFRKAFPKRFVGIYTPEEMQQGDVIDVTPQQVGATAKERVAARRQEVEAAGRHRSRRQPTQTAPEGAVPTAAESGAKDDAERTGRASASNTAESGSRPPGSDSAGPGQAEASKVPDDASPAPTQNFTKAEVDDAIAKATPVKATPATEDLWQGSGERPSGERRRS
jgi:phage recombination protein Bet